LIVGEHFRPLDDFGMEVDKLLKHAKIVHVSPADQLLVVSISLFEVHSLDNLPHLFVAFEVSILNR